MEKLRNWLIHKLGGYTRTDTIRAAGGLNAPPVTNLHPRRILAAYAYFVNPDTLEALREQEQVAKHELAKKIAGEMLDQGMIRFSTQVDAVQDRLPLRRYRTSATVWAVDATQMPVYGGGAP